MDSVYEKLMCLPVFKGASVDMIHLVAEKIPLNFSKFRPAQNIVKSGDICNSIICILGGEAIIIKKIYDDKIEIRQTIGPNSVIGVENLYGMNTHHNCTMISKTECGTVEISKKHYNYIVRNQNLFLINYLNILSRKIQRCNEMFCDICNINPLSKLKYLIELYTEKNSNEIEIITSEPNFDFFLGKNYENEFENFDITGKCELNLTNRILIRDREEFLLSI